ncbi:hypothetical protein LCGC14_2662230 [marine sediment metagenome]|uniref:Uncharacterized protein n=1 Tax=marine sediment metagenome TaxID=412755 RepID=A0A0F9ADZ3_9ZZZZ
MAHDATGWTRIGVSGRVTDKPCKVWGFIVIPSAATALATIYDGLDTGSGRLFGVFHASTLTTAPFLFSKPVKFDRGIYVDLTANITAVIVLWEPVS